jgi:hypothetical protein
MTEYQPGVCNIGKGEIRERYALAFMGFMISAALVSAIILYHLPRLLLFVSFIPLALGFEGFYQGRLRFCAGFAAAGVYNVDNSKKKVTDPADHSKDLKKAKQIHIYSVISAAAIAIAVYLLG